MGQGSHTWGTPAGEASEEAALRRAGCICSSPHLEFNSTDASLRRDHGAKFGHFHYTSTDSNGKPIYTRTPHSHTVPHSHGGTPIAGGRGTTARPPVTTTARGQPALYLFFYNAKKQWVVGPTVGSTSGVTFATAESLWPPVLETHRLPDNGPGRRQYSGGGTRNPVCPCHVRLISSVCGVMDGWNSNINIHQWSNG